MLQDHNTGEYQEGKLGGSVFHEGEGVVYFKAFKIHKFIFLVYCYLLRIFSEMFVCLPICPFVCPYEIFRGKREFLMTDNFDEDSCHQ